MGSANLTDQEIAMRYPPSIIAWEMKHGIARYERNGVTYICCANPLADVHGSIDRENAELAKKCGQNARNVIHRFDPRVIIDAWEAYCIRVAEGKKKR